MWPLVNQGVAAVANEQIIAQLFGLDEVLVSDIEEFFNPGGPDSQG